MLGDGLGKVEEVVLVEVEGNVWGSLKAAHYEMRWGMLKAR